MPLISLVRLSALVVSLVVASPMEAASTKSIPTPVEVWSGGDDGLTNRLRDRLESAFKSSVDFQLSSGKKPGTLVVTIPSNVDWKEAKGRTRVLYTVDFTSVDNQNLGASRGSCWDNKLEKCVTQIIRDAKIAARKVTSKPSN